MSSDLIPSGSSGSGDRPISPFDKIKRVVDGVDRWSAREMMPLMGYNSYRRFSDVIDRAKISCKNCGLEPGGVFDDAGKNAYVNVGRPPEDVSMTRFGCYLVAMNGDPRKPEVSAAQIYFAQSTIKMETFADRLCSVGVISARNAEQRSLQSLSTQMKRMEDEIGWLSDRIVNIESEIIYGKGVPQTDLAAHTETCMLPAPVSHVSPKIHEILLSKFCENPLGVVPNTMIHDAVWMDERKDGGQQISSASLIGKQLKQTFPEATKTRLLAGGSRTWFIVGIELFNNRDGGY